MQFGFLISVLLHVAILGGALISIHSRAEPRLPETEPVAVGMISPSEATKVRQGVRTAKLLEAEPKESPKGDLSKKEAAKPKMAAAAPPPPPPAAPEAKVEPVAPKAVEPPPPSPAPAAAAEAQKKLEAEQQKLAEEQRLAEAKKRTEQEQADAMQRAEEQRLAEEHKRAEEQRLADERKRAEADRKRLEDQRRRAELKKKRDEEKKRHEAALKKKRDDERKRQEAEAAKSKQFDADKISALLNKDKAAPPPPSAAPDRPSKAKGATLGAPDGRDRQISASERAMIGQVIKSCVIPNWTVLSGGASAQETVVKIRLRFNEDGTLSAPPVITNPQETPYFRAISESALRAVQQCEPYNLPPDLYEHWRDIIMNFNPKDMF